MTLYDPHASRSVDRANNKFLRMFEALRRGANDPETPVTDSQRERARLRADLAALRATPRLEEARAAIEATLERGEEVAPYRIAQKAGKPAADAALYLMAVAQEIKVTRYSPTGQPYYAMHFPPEREGRRGRFMTPLTRKVVALRPGQELVVGAIPTNRLIKKGSYVSKHHPEREYKITQVDEVGRKTIKRIK